MSKERKFKPAKPKPKPVLPLSGDGPRLGYESRVDRSRRHAPSVLAITFVFAHGFLISTVVAVAMSVYLVRSMRMVGGAWNESASRWAGIVYLLIFGAIVFGIIRSDQSTPHRLGSWWWFGAVIGAMLNFFVTGVLFVI